jgi:hypothetical protein
MTDRTEPTAEEIEAVTQTKRDALRYPAEALAVHRAGTQRGHALVSCGGSLFRCVGCGARNSLRMQGEAFPTYCPSSYRHRGAT